jgi:hypothetical protein
MRGAIDVMQCDRCGRRHQHERGFQIAHGKEIMGDIGRWSEIDGKRISGEPIFDRGKGDLCPKCTAEFLVWIERKEDRV